MAVIMSSEVKRMSAVQPNITCGIAEYSFKMKCVKK